MLVCVYAWCVVSWVAGLVTLVIYVIGSGCDYGVCTWFGLVWVVWFRVVSVWLFFVVDM